MATMPLSRLLDILERQQGILGTGQVKLDANWVLLERARYDINAGKFDQTRLGLGYVDDCVILGLNYVTNYTYSGNVQANHTVMLQLNLRTLGGTSVSQGRWSTSVKLMARLQIAEILEC